MLEATISVSEVTFFIALLDNNILFIRESKHRDLKGLKVLSRFSIFSYRLRSIKLDHIVIVSLEVHCAKVEFIFLLSGFLYPFDIIIQRSYYFRW